MTFREFPFKQFYFQVLENLTANKPAERKKDGSFEESFHKRNKEENLAFQSIIGDLTSLSPLNEKTGLNLILCRSLVLSNAPKSSHPVNLKRFC